MEQMVAELRSETQTKLNHILTTITRLPHLATETHFPSLDQPEATSADHIYPRTARPSVPPDFDGNRAAGRAFLNACQIYFRLRPEEFSDEQFKIIWAMSYMKTGRAQKWTD